MKASKCVGSWTFHWPVCVCLCDICAGAAKLIGSLQTFKVKYAEARAKEHPELQAVYQDKIKGMKAAGGLGRLSP